MAGYKNLNLPGMQRLQSDFNLTNCVLPNLKATADNMGRPYRTPSPAKEAYISSSK
jgi:hypothetical protein